MTNTNHKVHLNKYGKKVSCNYKCKKARCDYECKRLVEWSEVERLTFGDTGWPSELRCFDCRDKWNSSSTHGSKIHSNKCGNEEYHRCEERCQQLVKCSEMCHCPGSVRCYDCLDSR